MGNVNLSEVAAQAEADAQWIINNTKPCPNCGSPIQKNEGCNHMTCRKVSECHKHHVMNVPDIVLP